MNSEIWQRLLGLESRDIVSTWFNIIHSRILNARRAQEINSAARQGYEYFRNASNADRSVRPLLTFYGVASLSRSVTLLLKQNGGEEGLSGSHGLETVAWGDVLSGGIASGIEKIGELQIRSTSGLFYEFLTFTGNRIPLHVRSSAIDWRLPYQIPGKGDQLSLDELISRIPDLQKDYCNISRIPRYALVNEMSYSPDDGLNVKVQAAPFSAFKSYYEECGYSISEAGEFNTLTCDSETFSNNLPLFTHSYLNKTFGAIPSLHIAAPFQSGGRYSQACITYMVSYILGMLVRYYPTHWIALSQGAKGDLLWPTINHAQRLVEESFPELLIELIDDFLQVGK